MSFLTSPWNREGPFKKCMLSLSLFLSKARLKLLLNSRGCYFNLLLQSWPQWSEKSWRKPMLLSDLQVTFKSLVGKTSPATCCVLLWLLYLLYLQSKEFLLSSITKHHTVIWGSKCRILHLRLVDPFPRVNLQIKIWVQIADFGGNPREGKERRAYLWAGVHCGLTGFNLAEYLWKTVEHFLAVTCDGWGS